MSERPESTVALRPELRRDPEPGSAAVLLTQSARDTISPHDTLHADEILRTRTFLLVAVAILLVGAAALPWLGGNDQLRWLLGGSCGVTALACLGLHRAMRSPRSYGVSKLLPVVLLSLSTAYVACHFFGLFSPAPMLLVLGIYFFGLSSSPSAAVLVYVMAAGLLGGGMLLSSLDLIPDLGVVSAADLPTHQRLIVSGLVQIVLLSTFVFARLSRRATLAAVRGHDQAVQEVRRRQALLNEAHQNLDAALGRGLRGVYSGQRIGAWVLGDVIGRGAMGEVYDAVSEDGAPAALKLLAREAAGDPDKLRRFLLEAELMSRLRSPHIVRVLGIDSGTVPYIAMERLAGHDLGWHLRKRKRLPVDETVELISQVATALEAARQADVVHRDLKPTNVFYAEDDARAVWKVLDFGVSKLGAAPGTLTQGHVIGTPGYMAPEQAQGLTVDHRADVFALAVIAYRALTGHPPFSGDDVAKVMFDLVYRQPAAPSSLVELAPDLEATLALGLAKHPADRIDTAIELAQMLADAAESRLRPEFRARAESVLQRSPWGRRVND